MAILKSDQITAIENKRDTGAHFPGRPHEDYAKVRLSNAVYRQTNSTAGSINVCVSGDLFQFFELNPNVRIYDFIVGAMGTSSDIAGNLVAYDLATPATQVILGACTSPATASRAVSWVYGGIKAASAGSGTAAEPTWASGTPSASAQATVVAEIAAKSTHVNLASIPWSGAGHPGLPVLSNGFPKRADGSTDMDITDGYLDISTVLVSGLGKFGIGFAATATTALAAAATLQFTVSCLHTVE